VTFDELEAAYNRINKSWSSLVLGILDVDFEVESPPELTTHLRKLSRRFADAATR
jgi:hypothetical protein